ncbi:MAG TPA: spermidine/putrescine ABC transporter substrate-binding protein [Bryobacteraceae bacterium]|nr:spermidine/putrescine ABC transporter substrate-binding protein [Bryobacteraceae bacterium]
MKRRYFLFGSFAPAIAACRRDRRPRLNVYNWSAYVAPDTIPNFEKEFGARIRYVTYESNEEMLAQVITGNSGWDIVFPTHNRVSPMSAMGLLAPLEHSRLKNLSHLEPQFQAPSWDRGLEWCVPYMWFGTGIAFNRSVAPPPSTWADLWSPRFKGRLTMLDDPEDVIGASLMKLGLPFGSTDPVELHRAQHELFQQKPLVRAYLNAEVRDQLVSGDVLVAQLWSTTAAQALDVAPSLNFAFPAEGYPLYCDCAVILRESRRRELAHEFLDYLLRPPVSAAIAQSTLTATANASGRALLPDKVRNSAALYPAPDVLRRGEWPGTLPPAAQRLRDRIWTEVKAA